MNELINNARNNNQGQESDKINQTIKKQKCIIVILIAIIIVEITVIILVATGVIGPKNGTITTTGGQEITVKQ